MEFKKEFEEKYSKLTNWGEYKEAISKFPRKSIRVNTLKISVKELKEALEKKSYELEQIPWCNEGFWVKERRDLATSEEHKKGYFFIQGSVSMIPSIVLDLNEEDLVLDMCASPGGKTTHMASIMNNKGLILANEAISSRLTALIFNLQRCGVMNTIVTYEDALKLKGKFDKILLDAPCSASGTIIGDSKHTERTLLEWNQNTILRLAKLQKKLILKAYELLKENGVMVYSTCSLEPEEDEEVVQYLLDKTDAKLERVNLDIKADWNNGIKIWPQYYGTEGFFVSKIIKE
ncbi:RsmB/NOP family class I SAM-dependent RNA methyltransferase [Candidatus Woesearchaeota archaeon]|nr:RsmB/NOP family class I SAM-dependent RNA methyltransferase [Candidatus Woesearchaeota archaeon]